MTARSADKPTASSPKSRPSALIDTRVVYLEQLRRLPDGCVDLIYIDPPFKSNRNDEVFGGESREKRAFADRQKGSFVAFGHSDDALREIDAFFRKHKRVIVALTARERRAEAIAKSPA